MGRNIVRQPDNGLYMVYSTVSDGIIDFDLTREECALYPRVEISWGGKENYERYMALVDSGHTGDWDYYKSFIARNGPINEWAFAMHNDVAEYSDDPKYCYYEWIKKFGTKSSSELDGEEDYEAWRDWLYKYFASMGPEEVKKAMDKKRACRNWDSYWDWRSKKDKMFVEMGYSLTVPTWDDPRYNGELDNSGED